MGEAIVLSMFVARTKLARARAPNFLAKIADFGLNDCTLKESGKTTLRQVMMDPDSIYENYTVASL